MDDVIAVKMATSELSVHSDVVMWCSVKVPNKVNVVVLEFISIILDDNTKVAVVHFPTVQTCNFQLPETEMPQKLFTSNVTAQSLQSPLVVCLNCSVNACDHN